jgi:hypothetical protein
MGTRQKDKHQLLTHTCINQTTSWLVHSLSTFGAKTKHEQIQIHNTHHNPNLGEATTFPLIVYFVPLHKAHIQMTFWEIPKVGTLTTLGPHNFVRKPLIEMRSKAKL